VAQHKYEPFYDKPSWYWLKSELPLAVWRKLVGGELAQGNRKYATYAAAIEDLTHALENSS